jgi:alpha-methylacyl-CoA racemase
MRAALYCCGQKGACHAPAKARHFARETLQWKNKVLDKSSPQVSTRTSGPLAGFRIVEFAGIGPGPFACMMLADMGAEVVTLDRVGAKKNLKSIAGRGRKVAELDLKDKASIAQALDLLANADALIEGFRPGVMERLGLGPDVVLARNPRLVFGRMTGWGQEGPLAQAAGHDINYISVTGALAAIGTRDKPVPPLNLVGDFGGGALYLVVGVLAALLEAQKSGKGQVVDAAMCDGAASLMSMFFDLAAAGRWTDQRETNFLDGGAHFYGVYECSCGQFVSIGSIEPQFYALLRERAGLSEACFDAHLDRDAWPALKEKLVEVFKTKSRDEWCKIMEGTDICFAPILTMQEAPHHPHMAAREIFVTRHGVTQPAPAPRFSRTPSAIRDAAKADIAELTSEWGTK